MTEKKEIRKYDTTLFLEELQKRIAIPEGEFEKFLALWEFKKFNRNEFSPEPMMNHAFGTNFF